jgi:uncharacterized membrane protein YkvA (DUF1232 family)
MSAVRASICPDVAAGAAPREDPMPRSGRVSTLAALAKALRTATRPGGPGLGDQLHAVPRWVGATLSGAYPGTNRGRLVTLTAGLLYLVSPVDLLPEALLPFLGLADDAMVAAWLAGQLLGETDNFLRWERERGESGGRGRRRPAAEDVVPGDVVR